MSSSSSASYSAESVVDARRPRTCARSPSRAGARPSAPAEAGRCARRSAPGACRESGRVGSSPSSSEHAHRLLDEERVALRLVEQRAARPSGRVVLVRAARRRAARSPRAGSGSSSIAVDADASAAPTRPDVEQLRPREADDQQRRARAPTARGGRSARAAAPRPSGCPRTRGSAAGRRRARPRTRARPRRSPAGRARPRRPPSRPTARPSSSAIASSPQHSMQLLAAPSPSGRRR